MTFRLYVLILYKFNYGTLHTCTPHHYSCHGNFANNPLRSKLKELLLLHILCLVSRETGAPSVLCRVCTRSPTNLKLRHSLNQLLLVISTSTSFLYRLWNSLPPINLNHSIPTIKRHITRVLLMNCRAMIRVLFISYVHVLNVHHYLPLLSPSLRSPDNFSGVPSIHLIPLSFISTFTHFLVHFCVL